MGLLIVGKPLKWRAMQKYKKHVKRHGIIQFINVWKKAKDRRQDKFLWGDEIEGIVLVKDPNASKVRLSLRAQEILQDLEAAEAKVRELDPKVKWNATFHPEYGCFMVEATPAAPYGGYTSDLRLVEANMRLRRALIESVLRPGEVFVTLTNFPQMGVADFTSPPLPPRGPILKSAYVPDGVMSPHPRFASLSGNIRRRRGARVNIKVPLFIDTNTLKTAGSAGQAILAPDPLVESDDEALATSPVRVESVFRANSKGSPCAQCAQTTVENPLAASEAGTKTAWTTARTVCAPIEIAKDSDDPNSLRAFVRACSEATNDCDLACKTCARIRVSPDGTINSTPIELLKIQDKVSKHLGSPNADAQSLMPATEREIHMDAMGFGMGCCCLQVTFQTRSIEEARHLYDQLAVVAPIMLALTANTPFFRGRIADTDVRWNVISMSVDDRTLNERGIEEEDGESSEAGDSLESKTDEEDIYNDEANEANVDVGIQQHPTVGTPSVAPHGLLRKSRYSSIDCYLGQDIETFTSNEAVKTGPGSKVGSRPILYHDRYNDIEFKYDAPTYRQLREAGIDELLAKHIASLFVRDPLVMFEGKINVDDTQTTEHFESVQSTNWRSVRFKPPPVNSDIGWRVEFRTMEVQMTDFENAAFTVFIALLTRAISFFNLNFYIPLSKVEENFVAAHARDAVNTQKFYFRKYIRSGLRKRTGPGIYSFAQSVSETPTNAVPDLDSESWTFSSSEVASSTDPCDSVEGPATITTTNDDYYEAMTMAEIFVGKPSTGYPGLLPIVRSYLDIIKCDPATRSLVDRYLGLIELRALGVLMTGASWMRRFVEFHPSYKHDSILTDDIVAELSAIAHHLAAGRVTCPELLGDLHEPSFAVPAQFAVSGTTREDARTHPDQAARPQRIIRVPSSSSSIAAMQALGCCSDEDEGEGTDTLLKLSRCASGRFGCASHRVMGIRAPCASLACPVAGPACSYPTARKPKVGEVPPEESSPLVVAVTNECGTRLESRLVPPHPLQEDEPLIPQPALEPIARYAKTDAENVAELSLSPSGSDFTRNLGPASPFSSLNSALAAHYYETRQHFDSGNNLDDPERKVERTLFEEPETLDETTPSPASAVLLRGPNFSNAAVLDKRLDQLLSLYTASAATRAGSAAFNAARAEAESKAAAASVVTTPSTAK